jgi:hypothetical protein
LAPFWQSGLSEITGKVQEFGAASPLCAAQMFKSMPGAVRLSERLKGATPIQRRSSMTGRVEFIEQTWRR